MKHLSGAPLRLDWKGLPGTNTLLVYYKKSVNYVSKKFYSTGPWCPGESVTKKKRFITLASESGQEDRAVSGSTKSGRKGLNFSFFATKFKWIRPNLVIVLRP